MIHLQPAARQEIQRIRSKHPNSQAKFRLGVQPGGCAELVYTLGLDETVTSDDRMFDCEGIPMVVDHKSWTYLEGLSLDYSEDLMGGGFRFNNPNALSSCGCGNSFSITADAASGLAEVPPQYDFEV